MSKLKLNQLSNMKAREMNKLKGGENQCCGCGCNGSSSTTANANANWKGGHSISAGGNIRCACHDDNSHWDNNFN